MVVIGSDPYLFVVLVLTTNQKYLRTRGSTNMELSAALDSAARMGDVVELDRLLEEGACSANASTDDWVRTLVYFCMHAIMYIIYQ